MSEFESTTLTEKQQCMIFALVESFAQGKLHQSDEDRLAVFRLLAESLEARAFAEEVRLDEAYIADAFDFEVDQSGNKKLAEWILRQTQGGEAATTGQGLGTEPDNAATCGDDRALP